MKGLHNRFFLVIFIGMDVGLYNLVWALKKQYCAYYFHSKRFATYKYKINCVIKINEYVFVKIFFTGFIT